MGGSEYVYMTYAAYCIRHFDQHMRCELLRRLNSGVAIRYARNVGLMSLFSAGINGFIAAEVSDPTIREAPLTPANASTFRHLLWTPENLGQPHFVFDCGLTNQQTSPIYDQSMAETKPIEHWHCASPPCPHCDGTSSLPHIERPRDTGERRRASDRRSEPDLSDPA